MRTKFLDLSRSLVDMEIVKLARQEATKRFSKGSPVFVFINGKNYALATDPKNFLEGIPKDSNERSRYLSKIHQLAISVYDEEDFKRDIERIMG